MLRWSLPGGEARFGGVGGVVADRPCSADTGGGDLMRAKVHKDVEYAVDDASGDERIFGSWDEAAGFALSIAAMRGQSTVDVLVYSEAGARFSGGDDAVEEYLEDPEASVFRRIEVSVNDQGRVA
jgi:hypothetical protein